MWGIELAVMCCMVVLNGLFAAYEIALASVSQARLHALAEEGRTGSGSALKMKESIEGSLAVVQLGITLVGAVAAATAGAGAQEDLAPHLMEAWGWPPLVAEGVSVVLVVIPLTLLLILFGELIPKVFALRNPELVVLRMSVPMSWFAWGVWPVVWLLESLVKWLVRWVEKLWKDQLSEHNGQEPQPLQELRASATIARTSRLIGTQEEKIILEAADLANRSVKEAMLPAEFISLLNAESSASDALVAAHLDMHTRFPVTETDEDPQGIIGYVNFKDIVAHLRFSPKDPSLRNIVRSITSFSHELAISEALEELIHEHTHIALVRDDSGSVLGMVTLEDLIEELLGDIEDEYDRLPAHLVAAGRGWIAGGGVTLSTLQSETGLTFDGEDDGEDSATTLNDWISARIEGPIVGSEMIEEGGSRVQVRKSRRHKVMEAYLLPVDWPRHDPAGGTTQPA